MDTHTYTDCLSLNSGSRSRTQTWEPCWPVGLGRVLVHRVFCAWCHGEAVRGGALGRAVLAWQWQGRGAEAALPRGGRARSCRGSPGTTCTAHGVGSAAVAEGVCAGGWRGSVCVRACVPVCVCVAGEGVFVCQCIALPQWHRNYLAETFSNGKKLQNRSTSLR